MNKIRPMPAENLNGVDLNLLVALDALLTHKSVTGAGRQLGLSQPATSHALRRLRELFDDPLLVQVGRKMVLTPRAEILYPSLQQTLRSVQHLLTGPTGFAPETTTQTFTLACPDLLAAFLPDILQAMTESAPGARLSLVRPLGPQREAALARGDVDIALGAAVDDIDTLVSTALGRVHWGVMMRKGHPLTRGRITAKSWVRYPHVVVQSGNQSPNRVAGWLKEAGLERTVGLTVPTFLLAPHVLARSDYLFTGPRELLARLAEPLDLILKKPPISMPPVNVALMWHPRTRTDPAHTWFREVVTQVTKAILKK